MRLPRFAPPLFVLLAACPPALHDLGPATDDDDGDDDSTAGDDDTGDDDISDDDVDDDDIVVDDDTTEPGCTWEGASMYWISSSLGLDLEGTWYSGEFVADPEGATLDLLTADGASIQFRADQSWIFSSFVGPGRAFWYSPGTTFAQTDFVFAAETDDGSARIVIGNESYFRPGLELAPFTLSVQPDPSYCADTWDDGCGLAQALPVLLNWSNAKSAAEALIYPESTVWLDDSHTFTLGRSMAYQELWCEDASPWQYSYRLDFSQVIIGVR